MLIKSEPVIEEHPFTTSRYDSLGSSVKNEIVVKEENIGSENEDCQNEKNIYFKIGDENASDQKEVVMKEEKIDYDEHLMENLLKFSDVQETINPLIGEKKMTPLQTSSVKVENLILDGGSNGKDKNMCSGDVSLKEDVFENENKYEIKLEDVFDEKECEVTFNSLTESNLIEETIDVDEAEDLFTKVGDTLISSTSTISLLNLEGQQKEQDMASSENKSTYSTKIQRNNLKFSLRKKINSKCSHKTKMAIDNYNKKLQPLNVNNRGKCIIPKELPASSTPEKLPYYGKKKFAIKEVYEKKSRKSKRLKPKENKEECRKNSLGNVEPLNTVTCNISFPENIVNYSRKLRKVPKNAAKLNSSTIEKATDSDTLFTKRNYYTFKKHKNYKHLKSKNNLNTYKCSICNYETSEKYRLSEHSVVHNNEKLFNCTECDFGTNYKKSLSRHMNTHFKLDVLKCSKCDYETHARGNLLRHLKCYHAKQNKSYQCLKCSYKGFDNKSFTKHMLVHLTNKEFKCAFCKYETNRKDHMKRHFKRHL